MCGLTGIWDPRADLAALEPRVRAMTAALAHRGPDGEGVHAAAGGGPVLGHRRLAVLDLRPAAGQPMVAADGCALVFNGEVYNHCALRAELEREGAAFRTGCDTEVVLEALRRRGAAALEGFRGMFALAFWDARTRELLLARDRLGIKPLSWSVQDGVLRFASELKGLMADPAFRRGLDRGAAAAFLRRKAVPAGRSILRGVQQLEPGRWLRFRAPDLAPEGGAFWSFEEVRRAAEAAPWSGDEDALADRFLTTLDEAVALRLVADVPVGAFLSGGVDSSLVVARMQALASSPVKTFTVGFDEDGFDEAPRARAVAAALGTEHHEVRLTAADALELVPELPRWWDEPLGDSSQLATQLVCRFARQQVTVALSGDGGDELFGGYGRYAGAFRRWQRLSRLPFRRLAGRLLGERSSGALLRCAGFDEFYEHALATWKVPDDLVLGARLGPALGPDPPPAGRDGAFARMTAADTVGYLPDDILAKLDRASMSCSLEARVPLLDHELVAAAWRVPAAARYGAGGKPLLRRLLARQLPAGLVTPGKKGFSVPVAAWLRGPLREWAEGLLDPERLADQGLLRVDAARRSWARLLAGDDAERSRVWNLLMLQAWIEQWSVRDLGGGEEAG